MKRDLGKWREKTPNQHRSYGEKRNRDEINYLRFCLEETNEQLNEQISVSKLQKI